MSKKTIGLLSAISLIFISLLGLLIFIVLKNKTTTDWMSKQENINLTASKTNFGIDISHYQGEINWEEVNLSEHKINYVFIRATMGKDGSDSKFQKNWINAKKNNYLRGAYHYYRPNENSVKQFLNFTRNVVLEPGDLPPVLDIEEMSVYGRENLIAGILNWLRLVEDHYGVKPVVYTGASFYQDHLKGRLDPYPLWIAAYSGTSKLKGINWKFHQFSDRIKVNGINAPVDGNSFNGELSELIDSTAGVSENIQVY